MEERNNKTPKRNSNYYWLFVFVVLALILVVSVNVNTKGNNTIEDTQLENFFKEGDIQKIIVVNDDFAEIYIYPDSLQKTAHEEVKLTTFKLQNSGPHYTYANLGNRGIFNEKVDKFNQSYNRKVNISWETRQSFLGPLIGWLLPLLLFITILMFFIRRMGGGGAGGSSQIFSIGKSKATLFEKDDKIKITFKDVAGLDEAKEEVVEVVDFLRTPKKYTALGGKIPKGVLLVGSPGTGKTLLAKAVAGEAGVPFFSISGSDFVEMFVGVGASRVRDLFKQARDKAPCIIFIDEIDAIGRARGRNAMQGNDERENTLNQLLVEMDGFSSDKAIIIMAATNRPDILDSALMRPGRFDRQITIDKPDLVGREQIFKVHLKPLKLADDIDAKKLASQTPGFAGADIANICNEAALIAARRNKKAIDMADFNSAIDRVIGGLEKKNKIISPEEKRVIAYHEAGHTLCMWYLEHADSFVKVTIVPRGMAGGYAQYLPKEKTIETTEEILDKICITLGGRAAEDIIFNKISTGAGNDLMKVTQMAYAMITYYGMNSNVGNISFYDPQGNSQFTRPYSDETAHLIDIEAREIIEKQYARAKQLLTERSKELELVAEALMSREVLDRDDIEKLIGKRPFSDVNYPDTIVATPEDAISSTEPTDNMGNVSSNDAIDNDTIDNIDIEK